MPRPASASIELLFDLNATGSTTLVLVTHDKSLASRCGAASCSSMPGGWS